LCVAYSGQCLTSEASAVARPIAASAPACRLPYELIADGKPVPLGDRRYLLSPQDLAGLELLPDLIRAASRRSRSKAASSPRNMSPASRDLPAALDQFPRGGVRENAGDISGSQPLLRKQLRNGNGFFRGLYTGWLCGTNNQKLIHDDSEKTRRLSRRGLRPAPRLGARALEGPLKPVTGGVRRRQAR